MATHARVFDRFMNPHFQKILKIGFVALILCVTVTPIGLWLASPHGGPGGYFYLLGALLVYPVLWFSANYAPFTGLLHWIAAFGLQFVYVFSGVLVFRFLQFLAKRVKN
jgi:hypothetical protein